MKLKYFKIILFVLLAGISSLTFASGVESFTVKGLKIILKTNTSNDIISANIYFRGGATVLNTGQAGIENFALQVAQEATKNYPKDKLNAALERMNSVVTSFSGLDYSGFSLRCVKNNFNESWNIFSDMLLNPAFDKEDVELIRDKIISNIKQNKDNPDQYLNDLANLAFFVNHPYDIDPGGTEESVSSFTGDELKSYLKNRLRTSEMLLVVVGNTTRSEVEKMVSKSFGSLRVGNYSSAIPPAVKFQEPSIKVVYRDLPTNYIQGYFPAPAFGTKESYAMMIGGSILRDRLFQEVRTNRGLSYAPAAGSANLFSNFGFIYVTAVDPDTTIKVMHAEVDKMINEKVSASELVNKVNVMITRYYLANETSASQANVLAGFELSGAGYAESENYQANMKSVTVDDIMNVFKTNAKNLQFVLLGNPQKLETGSFMF